MEYDVIIVGAGPTGYMCAYRLLEQNKNLKVLLVDKGKDIKSRICPLLSHKLLTCPKTVKGTGCLPSCSITTGFGGAGAFSDGKFNITSQFGGWLSDYISEEQLLSLIKYCDDVNLKFGATKVLTDPYTDEVRKIEQTAIGVGLMLLRAKVRHLGTEENVKILSKIKDSLSEMGADFIFEKALSDIIVKDSKVQGVVLEDGREIKAGEVVLGLGREGSTFLEKMLRRHNVGFRNNQVDIGVRVETSNIVMQDINKYLYEGKFVFNSHSGTQVRTFCSNPSGHVVVENDDGVILANGHSYNDPKLGSENTNFALLVSHKFSEPFTDPNQFAKDVASLANRLSCGSVIVQKYGDLKRGRRSTPKRIEQGFVRPTLKEAVPGDLGLCLPYKTLASIIDMIEALDHVTPGIANEHTLLYGVEAKFYSARPDTDMNLEVKGISNLYCGGDGAGITRGLAQAGASGVLIADSILSKGE
ncbi:MAG: NAD(P)/FAD-dependent oxidoreductase [Bacilli bacterium]